MERGRYYFFATFVNEVADNLFVVPTTTANGWKCKVRETPFIFTFMAPFMRESR
jgi:hypothetical protein